MTAVSVLRAVGCVVLCLAAGWIGSLSTRDAIPQWYSALNKPALCPPSWAFGVVWPILYVLMGIAVAMILGEGLGRREVRTAAIAFVIQLALNASWSPIFFGLRRIDLAMVNLVLLWVAIVATIILFSKVSRIPAMLLAPYLLWVSFAAYLNAAFWIRNP
jgi:translocator protein